MIKEGFFFDDSRLEGAEHNSWIRNFCSDLSCPCSTESKKNRRKGFVPDCSDRNRSQRIENAAIRYEIFNEWETNGIWFLEIVTIIRFDI